MGKEKDKSGEAAAKMMAKMRKMKDELDSKLESLFQKGGMTLQKLEDFLNNQRNFSDEEWLIIQTQSEVYKSKLQELFGKKTLEKHEKKIKKKTSEGRNRKTLGERKKWIPMR